MTVFLHTFTEREKIYNLIECADWRAISPPLTRALAGCRAICRRAGQSNAASSSMKS